MADMVESTMDKGNARSTTPETHIVSMARVMLGNSADAYGGCEQDSFVKGYEKGFNAGWGFGFAQALEEGRRQGRRELEAEIDAAERIRKAGGAVCLLSDVARILKDDASDTSFINEEDVYYEAGDQGPSPGSNTSMEVRHDTSPHGAAFIVESADNNNSTSADLRELQSEEKLMDFFDDTERDAPISFPGSTKSSSTEPRAESPTTSAASVRGQVEFDVFYDSTPKRTGAGNNVTTPGGALVLHSATLIDLTTPSSGGTPTPAPRGAAVTSMAKRMAETMAQTPVEVTLDTAPDTMTMTSSLTDAPANTMANSMATLLTNNARPETTTNTTTDITPETTTNTTSPTLPSTPPSTLYNIPLAHTITPITPNLTLPPQHHRPRPAYPTLAGAFNIHALAARGATVVENPWRVLIGPLSPAAREAWKGDAGKGYLRVKLGAGANGYPRAGRCSGARWDNGGVVFCEMVHDETEEEERVRRWYVLAMFESQERAGEAVRVFQGFACGGSIMWAWIFREEE